MIWNIQIIAPHLLSCWQFASMSPLAFLYYLGTFQMKHVSGNHFLVSKATMCVGLLNTLVAMHVQEKTKTTQLNLP
jgi:hypothetical protein